MSSLRGVVTLVTGGSRGVGKGMATQLAKAGTTCYVTGRSKPDLDVLDKAVNLPTTTGKLIPIVCNHSDDKNVEEVFKRIEKDEGKLDLLVNNAFAGLQYMCDNAQTEFWKQPLDAWERTCDVGVRSHYIGSQLGARIMVKNQKGIIISVTSIGAASFAFTPLYGIGKMAVDRMSLDCSYQLRKHNIAMMSYWPSAVKTELIEQELQKDLSKPSITTQNSEVRWFMENGQTVESCGDQMVKLLELPHKKVMKMSGSVITAWEFGEKYKLTYENGKYPPHFLRLKTALKAYGYNRTAAITPKFITLPKSLLFPIHAVYRRPVFSTMLEV